MEKACSPNGLSSKGCSYDCLQVKQAARPFTIILDDPLANSYIQNLYAPDPDPNMTIEMYDRTFEQNDELGLNDIKVEGYDVADGEDSDGQEKDE